MSSKAFPSANSATLPCPDRSANCRLPLTAIVLTWNEQNNITACLEHLDWAEDIVVLDSFSDDRTIEVARAACPRVRVFQHAFTDFGQQRNWALDHCMPRHDWILFLDADELATPELVREIEKAIENPGDSVGFYLTCRNYFLGRWIRRCTFYPSWQLRLLRLGQVRFRKEGHGQREVATGRLEYLRAPYEHHGFSKGVNHWIARHNRYSSDEIELIGRLRSEPLRLGDLLSTDAVRRRRCLKRLAARAGFRPVLRFFYIYVIRGGFLDGMPGLYFCLLRVAHEIHITVKLAESKCDGFGELLVPTKSKPAAWAQDKADANATSGPHARDGEKATPDSEVAVAGPARKPR